MSTSIRTVIIAMIGATTLGAHMLCAQAPARDSSRVPQLPKVITTASRYDAPADSLPRRVEVISRTQLDATAALDMVDLLKKRTNLDVVQYPGLLGGIGIRGFRPQVGSIQQRNMILLDGRPSGITNLSMLDLQDVERVEVSRGPRRRCTDRAPWGGS
jgi:vitamin B12 transporter